MDMDDIVKLVNEINAVYEELFMEYAKVVFRREWEPGGAAYAEAQSGVIASAAQVYAGYTPVKYQRRYSLMNPDNVQISIGEIEVSGNTLSASISVRNIATGEEGGLLENTIQSGWGRPPFYWSDGPRVPWEIGGRDMYSLVPDEISLEITVPSQITEALYDRAINSVLS